MNRILSIADDLQAQQELAKINVSSGGIESMFTKMNGICIKLEQVQLAAANILKQEMLSLGGDAAVARGVVNGTIGLSDVILIGNADKLKRLTAKLNYQQYFGLPRIKDDILRLLANRLGENCSTLSVNGKNLSLDQTRIIGILNVTPDSFSDGNQFLDKEKALKQAKMMIAQGADIIDIGGESTRPGAEEVTVEEELRRTIEVIKSIRADSDVIISIDTTKAVVAKAAIEAGADIVNDISALRFDPEMADLLKENPQIGLILMHMQGTPRNMQNKPHYEDVISEIIGFLADRISFCQKAGIAHQRILIDPGIGFGKRQEDNLLILQRLKEFHCLNQPLVVAASRKSFIGKIYPSDPADREEGTMAVTALAQQAGVHFVRVHDVKKNQRMLKVLEAIGQVK